MSDIPIVSIQIDTDALDSFRKKIDDLNKDVSVVVDKWSETEEIINKIKPKIVDIDKVIDKTTETTEETAETTGKIVVSVDLATVPWATLNVTVHRASDDVNKTTSELSKWQRLTAVFSALVGAGGLFGLNTLAASIAMRRQQASGANVSIGEASAFRTDFGRLGNTDALLQGFNEAASNPQKSQPLASLGIDSRGKDAAKLFVEAFPKIARLADSSDPRTLRNTYEAYNLGQLGVTPDMFQMIREMSPQDRADLLRSYGQDVQKMDIPDAVAEKWQQFDEAIGRAKSRMGTAIAKNLINIEPGITALSTSLVKVIDKMIDSGVGDELLTKLGHGIDWIADEVGSADARQKVKDFLSAVTAVDHAIGTVTRNTFDFFKRNDDLNPLTEAGPDNKNKNYNPNADPMADAANALGAGAVHGFLQRHGMTYDSPPASGTGSSPGAAPSATHPPAPQGSSDDDSFLDERSKREMSGVNAPLAKSLIEAANASGIKFRVLQGRRTAEEAAGNAARGVGVKDSQHLYGAAADIRLIDPSTGKESRDPALYRQFANSFNAASAANGQPNQRWLGGSGGRWSWDISHFDQGIGYGQSHSSDPYGHASAPSQDDIQAARTEEYKSPDNPFMRRQSTALGQNKTVIGSHPNESRTKDDAVKIIDNTGGSTLISVPH